MTTVFKYMTGGRTVEHVDENDEYRPEDIKTHWAATFPELSNATWDEAKDDEGRKVITFAKKVGTKGANALRRYIRPGEVVVLNGSSANAGKKFTCQDGPGLNPKARGVAISGQWEDGSSGEIRGFQIDLEATAKLKEQKADAELIARMKSKGVAL